MNVVVAGSRGIRESNDFVRKGGAVAREMLIQAAANEWKAPAAECSASNSVITHKPSGRTTTYGKVAEAAAKLEPPAEVKLKDPKDWKIIGQGVKRLDSLDKVIGKSIYGIDVKLPGMLYAAIKACPVNGGKVKSFDAAKITGSNGVKKVVKVEDYAVAVIADSWWQAKTAIDTLPIVWDEGENAKVSSASIAAWLKEGLDAEQAFVGNKGGDVTAALASAAKKVEAVYSYPYQHHVTMEPQNATARYTADKCEVWCSTPERRSRTGDNIGGMWAAGPQVRGLQDLPRRRIRSPLDLARLRSPSGPDRHGDARHAGQTLVVARRGHDARLVSPNHPVQAHRRVRRRQEPDGLACAHFRPVDPCESQACRVAGRSRSSDVLWLLCGRDGIGDRVLDPKYSGRSFDA
jgi:molybdopterin-binding aldehyde dehydrogenase-like protein